MRQHDLDSIAPFNLKEIPLGQFHKLKTCVSVCFHWRRRETTNLCVVCCVMRTQKKRKIVNGTEKNVFTNMFALFVLRWRVQRQTREQKKKKMETKNKNRREKQRTKYTAVSVSSVCTVGIKFMIIIVLRSLCALRSNNLLHFFACSFTQRSLHCLSDSFYCSLTIEIRK